MPVTHEDARIPNLVLINPRHAIVFYTQISVESGGMKNARILCEPGVAMFPMLAVECNMVHSRYSSDGKSC